jgi:CheY-like chemotaxis protein
MSDPFRVALIGFRTAEHGQLLDLFAPALKRSPAYRPVTDAAGSDFIVADADNTESLAEVVRLGLLDRTVYVGTQVPPDTPAWLARPLDATRLLRELDLLVVQHVGVSALEPPLHLRDLPPTPAATSRPPAPTLDETLPAPSTAAPMSTLRVLLVDDSEVALRYLESRLAVHGLRAERAQTSARAIELASTRSYDLVFVDVELGPGSDLDGLALCRHLKRRHARGVEPPAVVMVSAHHAEIDRARGELAGCDAYLGKPLDDEALRRVLVRVGAAPPPPKPPRPPMA